MRRILLALALLLAAAPLAAYTIYLKDGSSLLAREKYRIVGTTAHITLPNGAESVLPVAQIDVARTKAANASDFGDARVLGDPAATPPPPAAPGAPTLSDVAAQRRGAPRLKAATAAATVAPGPAAAAQTDAKGEVGRTPAGSIDFLRTSRTPIAHVEVGTTLGELLRGHGLQSVGIYEGSEPGRVLVDASTNSEGAVFQAIAAAAQALLELQSKQPGAVQGIELFLVTDRRQRAGQFLITAERAQQLLGKQIDLSAFFVKYVEF